MSQEKEREALIAFLQGAAPLDGVWFGERHPTEKGAFWWRKRLAALASQQAVKGGRIPSVLFDGYAVLNALSKQAQSRTSAENVSDVLDAVVRLLRASPPSREPLTAEALGIAMTNSYYDAASFIAGVRFAERHHGIHSREGGSKA